MTDNIIATISLTKPLQIANGETVETITLSQPKTGDVIRVGQPVAVEFQDGKINAKADPAKIAGYLPGCTGHPQIILDGMEVGDAVLMLTELEVFFTQQAVQTAGRMFSARSDAQPGNSL